MDTKKLRQKLLDLAIRGKLVPQDPNDEPASELLSRIHAEKLTMVERGELKPKDVKNDTVIYFGSDGLPYEKRADGKGEAKCIEGEIPFGLPVGWRWVRFSSFSLSTNTGPFGAALHKTDYVEDGIPVVNPANIRDGVIFPGKRVTPLTCKRLSSYVLRKGDFVIGRRGEMGRAAFVGQNQGGWLCGTGCFFSRMPCSADASFLNYLFKADYVKRQLEKDAIGTTLKNLNLNVLGTLLIPVPPLAEQRRIVDALDKYLALVDAIERDRADLEGLLAQLKSKVLDLAVRGELTERGPGDEPASELLARVREEKLAMVERGELKPKDVKGDTVIFTGSDGLRYEKPADGRGEPRRIEDEIPFELPEGWAWARLGAVCSLLRRGKSPVYTDDASIPVFAQKCNQPWGITLEKVKFLDRSALDRYGEALKLRSGDVVVNSTGTGTLGRVGVFDEGLLGDYPFIVPDSHVAVLRIMQPFESKYVFHLLRSEYGQGLIFSKQTGSTNQKELPAKEVALFLIPIPPLGEQRRIVKDIEAIISTTNL